MITIDVIERPIADKIIRQHHYSKTINLGTSLNFGVYYDSRLVGVAQFGTGVNPKGTAKHVKGSTTKDYMEFNRFWLSDVAPRNSESKAIGLIFKWFKQHRPDIKWLISFSDGIERNVGTIYQATNWIYTGYNKKGGLWITREGKKMHQLSISKGLPDSKRETLEQAFGTPLYRVVGGQFRYIYFLDKRWRHRLIHQPLDYPKLSNLKDYIVIKKENFVDEDLFDELFTLLDSKQL